MWLDRHRSLRLVLDVHLEVILQVFSDARERRPPRRCPRPTEVFRIANPRQLQELRAVEGSAAQRRPLRPRSISTPRPLATSTPIARVPSNTTLFTCVLGHQVEVRSVEHWVEVGPSCAQAASAKHVLVECSEAFLTEPVDVVGAVESGLDPGVAAMRRRGADSAGPRSSLSGPSSLRKPSAPARQVLHPFEVRQAVCPVPAFEAGHRSPLVVVHRVAALEYHPVDAR